MDTETQAAVEAAVETVVATTQGKVRGRRCSGISAFLGIPYAAPPFGPNRLREPRPAPRWDGVRDALRHGPTAPKPPYAAPFDVLLPDPVIPGQDCLNLNVWTPDPGGSGLAVMVWIHGGAFRNGSGAVPIYDGSAFARSGVVCVTLNYRLGVEGFAVLPGAPANRGILDQIAALEWIQENIAAFGGDPSNVTVFGESAGGMSVMTLLSLRRGLFRRAIAQSGAGHVAQDPGDALLVSTEMAARLGVAPTAEAFAELDPEEILVVQAAVAAEITALPDPGRWGPTTASSGMSLMPVLDGELLTARPEDAVAAGAGRDIDLLIGYTTEEFRLFLAPTGLIKVLNDDLVGVVATGMGVPQGIVSAYRQGRLGRRPGDVLADVLTDAMFRVPAHRAAAGHAAGHADGTERRSHSDLGERRGDDAGPHGAGAHGTYMYEFAWRTPERDMGACHALELGFVFDTIEHPDAAAMAGSEPPRELATAMHRAWVDFAVHGDPGWERFDPERRPVKVFDGASNPVVYDPRAEERLLWPPFTRRS